MWIGIKRTRLSLTFEPQNEIVAAVLTAIVNEAARKRATSR
jgi:hypothetical protein